MALRFGIGFKLGLASSVIILLSAGVIVSRQIAMSRIEAADVDVQRQSEILDEAEKVSIRLGTIRADLAEMRLSFANLGNDDLAKEIATATSAAQIHLDRLLELESHDDDREVFRTLKTRFTELGSAAAAVHASQTAQLNAVDARPAIRMRARSAFSALAMDLESAGKANAARAVATLDPLLDQITLASALFMIEEDPKQLTMIKVIDDTGTRTLAGMEEDVRADPRAAETLILAREAFAAYTKSIQDGIAELQARTALVQRRATPAMADAIKLLAEVTRESAQQSVEADHDADVAVDSGLFQILIFSILAIFASIASAAYSALGIARPVQRVSEAMEQLSSGATAVEIPYAERSDEVGDQARALTVFRDRLAETARLRSERREAEQAAAAQRKADMNDLADQFERAVGAVVDMVASAATELQTAAETLSSTAAETTAQATAVAGAATLATTNVQTVAAAIEELSASARDIGTRLRESTRMTERAVTEVDNTNDQMSELRASADQIGTIIGVIDTIAGQTNLLALNATIESARAGDAGRGFAVVAQEVKTLAGQTAKATADISERISGIQDSTGDVLGAITGFSRTISALSAGSMAIASAMEEQNATTAEVARSIQQAAAGTHEVTATIVGVEQAAHASSAAASQVLTSATDLSTQAELLRAQVKTFLSTVRAA